ncbi:hypothetical protein BDZ45DRAFT_582772 [Acephala macrosclerotiorum]|nr:hypothetical protein BDZ45DRAFT_582772 [Acephala macrosclerotiorum]
MPRRTSTKGAKGSTTTKSRQVAPNPIKERKKTAANPKLKQIFKGKVICSLGQFENCGKMLGPDDITKYVTLHGGRYEKQVTEDTTHFICSIADYKKKHPQGKSLGKSKCAIVVFDWLIDCLVSKKKACKAIGAYTLDRTIKRLNKGKKDHFEYRSGFDEGARACHEFVDNRSSLLALTLLFTFHR